MYSLIILFLTSHLSFAADVGRMQCDKKSLSVKKCTLEAAKVVVKLDEDSLKIEKEKTISTLEFPTQGSFTEWSNAELVTFKKNLFLQIKTWGNPSFESEQTLWLTVYKIDQKNSELVGQVALQTRSPASSDLHNWDLSGLKQYQLKKDSDKFVLTETKKK